MTELMLKLAAFLAMVIDHAAACRLDRVFFPAFSKVYVISRAIGRMAFPIYTFCLVEGFRHSHDLRRYGGRLLLLGVISQLPYAFTLNRWYLEPAFGEVFPADPSRAFRNLNILFTLFIGLVLLVFFHKKPLARVIQSKGFAVFLLACGGFAVYTADPEFDSRFRRLCTVLLLALQSRSRCCTFGESTLPCGIGSRGLRCSCLLCCCLSGIRLRISGATSTTVYGEFC